MPKIIKNGKEYSGVPIEVVTAWAPTADPVQVKEPLMGNTDISNIGDGTVTGAIDSVKTGLTVRKKDYAWSSGSGTAANTFIDVTNLKTVLSIPSTSLVINAIIKSANVATGTSTIIYNGDNDTFTFLFSNAIASSKTVTFTIYYVLN